MSASLVGSEMCIRDRYQGERSGGHQGVPEGIRGFQRVPRGRVKYWAVSYTHLTLPTICSV
eukprot:5240825-Alexandrium_andersonii.AAC.1